MQESLLDRGHSLVGAARHSPDDLHTQRVLFELDVGQKFLCLCRKVSSSEAWALVCEFIFLVVYFRPGAATHQVESHALLNKHVRILRLVNATRPREDWLALVDDL